MNLLGAVHLQLERLLRYHLPRLDSTLHVGRAVAVVASLLGRVGRRRRGHGCRRRQVDLQLKVLDGALDLVEKRMRAPRVRHERHRDALQWVARVEDVALALANLAQVLVLVQEAVDLVEALRQRAFLLCVLVQHGLIGAR